MAKEEKDYTIGRRPDWIIKACSPERFSAWSRVGVAWDNRNGSMTLRLNPFTMIPAETDLIMWPNTPKESNETVV